MGATINIPSIVTDNLVFCSDPQNYRSYIGSGTSATDLSTNTEVGTLTGGVGYSAPYWTFDGVNDYVDFGTDLSQLKPNDWTFCAWVNITSAATRATVLSFNAYMSSGAGYAGVFCERDASNKFSTYITVGSSSLETLSTSASYSSTTDWYYLAVTKSGTAVAAYVNDSADGTLTLSSSTMDYTTSGSLNNFIGATYTTLPTIFYTGNIGQVCIYNTALTTTQLTQNYNATKDIYL